MIGMNLLNNAIGGAADVLGSRLATAFSQVESTAGKFFASLAVWLGKAIAKAMILKAVLALLPGGGAGGGRW